ncbi:MAG TPA: hypothetical protein DDY13_01145 [Cytophagales bacterium]|jgi:transglutaminase-like putative cysteine protease|nr:hypothetical protein [Cytophagales bacterium]
MRATVFIIASCLVFISTQLFADKAPIKFGKVSMEELQMESYPGDPDAEAAILCDYGETRIIYTSAGFQIMSERTCRVKIFNKEGLDWADWTLYFYDGDNIDENINGLKGYTYNLENGKIVEEKLSKDNIYEEESSETQRALKFTMPKVKEGSVIEFTYKKTSDYFTLIDKWYFQRTIPVKHSEYIFESPEYFRYMPVEQGYARLDIRENFTNTGSASFTSKSRNSGYTGGTNYSNHTVKYTIYGTRFVAKDVPALKSEKYSPKLFNFLTSIEYQLSTVQWPQEPIKKILSDWGEINKMFLESENFGNQMKPRNFYKDDLAKIKLASQNDVALVYNIYRFISNNIEWDGKTGFYADNGIRKTYMDKTGNDADINLLFISMCRAAGLTANPVIMSTRSHGLVNPIYPIMSKYNYVIAEVNINGTNILVDATQSGLPLGLIPERCLNQMGRRICETNSNWVALVPYKGRESVSFCQAKIEDDGSVAGLIQEKLSGYAAIDAQFEIETDGMDKFKEKIIENYTNTEIKNVSVELDKDKVDVVEKFDFVSKGLSTKAGKMMYINPLLEEEDSENPFKNEKRELPVDFGSPIKITRNITLTIPEGYAVEEIPESIHLALPENAGEFRYQIRQLGNNLQIVSLFEVKKTFYSHDEYPYLRNFFSMVFEKQGEQLVLKKQN